MVWRNIKNKNSGISMITLIITIVVLIIIAAIAFNGSSNGINEAAKAKMKVDLEGYKEELRVFKMNQIFENPGFADDSLYATQEVLIYNTNKKASTAGNIKTVIPDIQDKYSNELSIIKGNLSISSEDVTLLAAAKELGIKENPYAVNNGVLVSVLGNNDLIDESGTLSIPPMITSIAQGAFANVDGLKTIIIPGTCKVIDESAFAYNTELEKIIMEDGVEKIGDQAFRDCNHLKEVIMANSVTQIGSSVFWSANSLTKINLSSNLKTISAYAFHNCRKLEEITIPEGLTSISSSAFNNCVALKTIYIPSTVTQIDGTAFNGDKALENIYIASGNTSFTSKNGIILGNGGTTISIIPPAAITGNIFEVPEGVTSLNGSILSSFSQINTVKIPKTVSFISASFFSNNITSIIINSSNPYYSSNGNTVYTDGRKTLFRYVGNENSIIVPDGVVTISANAFNGHSEITDISLPNSIVTIGGQAFSSCSNLTNLSLGKDVKNFNSMSIYSSGIENITIAEDNPFLKVINGALYSKDGNTFISPIRKTGSIVEYEIPEGVKEIAANAFHNQNKMTSIKLPSTLEKINSSFNYCTSLPKIEIPSGVTYIASGCFANCGTKLKEIIVNKPKGSISGAPWGSTYSEEIVVKWKTN